jgi:quercetin dioxygenase-like cupin family protein
MIADYKIDIAAVQAIELTPGYTARIIHTERMTFSFLDVKARSPSAEHAHPQEQAALLMEGEFELTIEGEVIRFGPGSLIVIPANARHSGLAITDCKLMDIFTPCREDFRALQEKQNQ